MAHAAASPPHPSSTDAADAAVALHDVRHAWPDGAVTLDGVTVAFGPARTGITGRNGAGKTTLLRLVAGDLRPTAGHVRVTGRVATLEQRLTLATSATVADLLGVRPALDALAALDAGVARAEHLELLDGQWDVEARASAALAAAGLDLGEDDLDRPVGTLSGGEVVLAALAGLRLDPATVTLLDEPTNNLDAGARARLHDLVRGWTGVLLVVSHDRALLDLMDATAEVRAGTVTSFGGNLTAFDAHLATEQEAAARAQRAAEHRLATERRQHAEAQVKLARRARYAKAQAENVPKILANTRKAQAQVSAGKLRTEASAKVESAAAALADARARVREDTAIRVDLPETTVPAGKRVLELRQDDTRVVVHGPERLALVGPNGAGKTTLLEAMLDPSGPAAARARVDATIHVDRRRVAHLTQRLDDLDDTATVLANLRAAAPRRTTGELRAQLARFRGPGTTADRARRAHQQPRPRDRRPARGRAAGLPRRAPRRQPRPGSARPPRDHPLAGGRARPPPPCPRRPTRLTTRSVLPAPACAPEQARAGRTREGEGGNHEDGRGRGRAGRGAGPCPDRRAPVASRAESVPAGGGDWRAGER